ncbi:MAG: recombinase family protein [Oscillospiraceae bacterium]
MVLHICAKSILIPICRERNSREISEKLNSQQALNRTWTSKTVDYVLQNERYAGNALLQKRYTTDSFPRVKKRNRGERMQYYALQTAMKQSLHRSNSTARRRFAKTEKRSSQKISVHIQKGASVPVAPDAANISIKFGTGFVLRMRNKKVSAQSSRYRRKLLTQRSAVCTTNSSTTATPSSRRCSRTSKKSATAGCSGVKM